MNKWFASEQKDAHLFGVINNAYNHIFTKENLVKSGFNHVYNLLSKQKRTLNIKCSDLRL